jgi:hypothetical protein
MRTEQGLGVLTQARVFSLQEFFLRIADITIAVTSNDLGMTFRLDGAIRNFLVDGSASFQRLDPKGRGQGPGKELQLLPDARPLIPEVRIGTAWDDLFEQNEGDHIFDSGALWQLYHQHGAYRFSFTSPALGRFPYKVASFNYDFSRGEVLLNRCVFNSDQPVYPLQYPLDELLVLNLLAAGRGVEVHACGVIDALGNGHLLVGQSGAGKTTMARLWQSEEAVTILSDDRIILRKDENKLWMYGTPWHGDAGLSCSTRAPLKQIYLLLHGQENELVPMRGAEAISQLFACSFTPFYSSAALDFTLAFLEEVVSTVPCQELRFVPNVNIVKFILERSAIS